MPSLVPEGDEVAGGMHGGTQHVFTGGESVAIDVPDKLSVLLVILPDAHGGAYPQVALMVFDDAAHLLSFPELRREGEQGSCCSFGRKDRVLLPFR